MSVSMYWDLQGQRLIPGLYGGGTVSSYTVVLRDSFPVSLYLLNEQSSITQPYAVTAITAGHAIKFGAKAALSDTTYLSEQATWASAGSGTTQRYEASIPVNGAALIAAMVGVSSLSLYAEFTTQDADGKQYLSTKFTLKIIHDVITGSEA